jgi:ligand-binding sensor domain-containing protein/signal transduction histidine kinase
MSRAYLPTWFTTVRSSTWQAGVCALVFVLAGHGLWAQRLDPSKKLTQFMLESFDRNRGLPQNTAHCILQSSDGFLWVGTYLGLARFDGVRFSTYNLGNTPELGSNGIFSLEDDHNGGLWIGTNGGGLVHKVRSTWRAYTTEHGLPNNAVMRLCLDGRGRLWIGTRNGLAWLENDKLSAPHGSEQLRGRTVRAFAEDGMGGVWIGTTGGLYKFDGKAIIQADLGGAVARIPNVFDLQVGPDGQLWIGSDLGLISYDGLTSRLYTQRDGLSDNVVNDVYVDHGGILWAGTLRGGINRFYQGKFTALTSRNSALRDDKIQSLNEDREGNLWIGTEGAGLYRLREGLFLNFGQQEGYGADQTYSVLQAPNGEMLFGTFNGGVIRKRADGSFSQLNKAKGLPTDYVRALFIDENDVLWVGTYGEGLVPVRGNVAGRPLTTRDGLPDNYVRAVFSDGNHGLWIGTRNGLSHYQQGKFTNYTTANGLPGNSVLCMTREPNGRLWIGTDGSGLASLDPASGKIDTLTRADGLSSDVVMGLYRDPNDGSLWVGSNIGLDRVSERKVTSFKSIKGLFGESIFQIIEGARGYLWMGTNNGVLRVSKSELLDLDAGRPAQVQVEQYNEADGMRSSECKANGHPSGLRSADGVIWFPTFAGVSALNPDRLQRNTVMPNVVIDRVQADGKAEEVDGQIIYLRPGVSKFEIEYTAPSFVSSEKVRFRYQLQGFESEWIDAGVRRIAYYTNVPPGDYTFKVLAANSDGVWNETGATVRLVVEPLFYQSMWFYVLLMVLAGLVSYGFYRWRIRDLRNRNDNLEQLVAARTAQIEAQTHQLEAQSSQLLRSNEEISRHNRTMAEKNSELSSALDRLNQTQDQLIQTEKHTALGQLVAGVAHEINTPVSIGITAASDLSRRANELQNLINSDELRKSDLERTLHAVRESGDIILFNLTRAANLIQSFKKVAVDQEHTDLSTIILLDYFNEILLSLGIELRQAGITSTVEGHPTLEASVPTGALTQIIINLVLNSLLHGFADPALRPEQPNASIRFRYLNGNIELIVADNGQGIAPEIIGRIFDPFFTTARQRGGTGLGLHIVYNLVTTQLRGSIDVKSQLGQGTEFTILFPQRVELILPSTAQHTLV